MNKTFLSITLPIAVFLGMSSSANADGYYLAANALHAEYEGDFDESGYNIAVGKYIGDGKQVSLEVGYTNFGDSSVTEGGIDGEFKASAVQFSAVGYVPLSPRAGIYGRVGAERIKTEASANTIRATIKETNPFFGVGGYYNVTENIDIRVEYQRHEQLDEYFDSYSAGVTVETF